MSNCELKTIYQNLTKNFLVLTILISYLCFKENRDRDMENEKRYPLYTLL